MKVLSSVLSLSSVLDSGQATSSTMPPKKSQKKESVKKKTSEKCKFHNRGYCNLKEECENIHSDKVCDDLDCNEDQCEKRYPCKFGPRCKFNKNSECMYLHVTLASNDDKIEVINQKFNKQFEKIENILKKVQIDSEQKDSEIKVLKGKYDNLEKLVNEKQSCNLKKDLEIKNAQINGMEMRIEELEKEHQTVKKEQTKKIKELENASKQTTRKVKDSETKIQEENAEIMTTQQHQSRV